MSSGDGPQGVVEDVKFEDIFGCSPEEAKVAIPKARDLLKEFFLAQLDETVGALNNDRAELDTYMERARAAMKKHPMDVAETMGLVKLAVEQGEKCRGDVAAIWDAFDIAQAHGLAPLAEHELVTKTGTARPQPAEASVTA